MLRLKPFPEYPAVTETRVEAEEIRQAVLATIESVAPDADVQNIPTDQPLRQAIELDSMDWLNVIAGLHDRLSIDIPESDYERPRDGGCDRRLCRRQAGASHG